MNLTSQPHGRACQALSVGITIPLYHLYFPGKGEQACLHFIFSNASLFSYAHTLLFIALNSTVISFISVADNFKVMTFFSLQGVIGKAVDMSGKIRFAASSSLMTGLEML